MQLSFLVPATRLLCAISALGQAALPDLPPVRIILVGDSTMAVKSGYGPGFCANFVAQVTCLDMAKGGRSSASFRAEGSWAEVMNKLKRNANSGITYVLIQFGHNDQPGKPGRSTDLATEFPVNMRRYVDEVKAAGAIPVLVTPLTRRTFRGGKLQDNLGPWADATKKVAAEADVPVLDLNGDSAAAVQKMGAVEANTLAMAAPPPEIAESAATGDSAAAPKNPAPTNADGTSPNVVERKGAAAPQFDYTHLGAKGSAFFGRMVADELARTIPDLRPYVNH